MLLRPLVPAQGPGLRIVKVFGDSIEHQYYPMDKVPDSVSVETATTRGSR